MFGLFKSNRKKRVDALVKQSLGGQAVLHRMFSQTYKCAPDQVRRLELTYFALSVMSFTYLLVSKDQEKEKVLDEASLEVLQRSIPSCGEKIELRAAAGQYQRRYQEYIPLIESVVLPSEQPDTSPSIQLGWHLYESVTGVSGRDVPMLLIAASGGILNQFLIDHVEYVKLLNRG